MRPLRIAGRVIHQIAVPWHWGYAGLSVGDSINDLLHLSGDPNTTIETTKTMTCNVHAGRRATPATSKITNAPHRHADVNREHPAEHPKLPPAHAEGEGQ
jgi:formate dehydrogenase major subunit